MVICWVKKDSKARLATEGLEEALSIPGVHVHLYGKLLTKPFRKMGHVTVCHPDLEEARRIARTIRDTLKVKA